MNAYMQEETRFRRLGLRNPGCYVQLVAEQMAAQRFIGARLLYRWK